MYTHMYLNGYAPCRRPPVGGWLTVGCWLLAAGCWLLVADCWLLAAGWLTGCWLPAWLVGCWLDEVTFHSAWDQDF